MRYKIVGFVVWQGGKWYLKRRAQPLKRKAAMATVAGVVVAGLAIAGRQAASD